MLHRIALYYIVLSRLAWYGIVSYGVVLYYCPLLIIIYLFNIPFMYRVPSLLKRCVWIGGHPLARVQAVERQEEDAGVDAGREAEARGPHLHPAEHPHEDLRPAAAAQSLQRDAR